MWHRGEDEALLQSDVAAELIVDRRGLEETKRRSEFIETVIEEL